MSSHPWYVYLLYSVETGRIYTGISTDPQRRLQEHNGKGAKGAKATRMGRPWQIVRVERYTTRGEALQREAEVKAQGHKAKLLLAGLSA